MVARVNVLGVGVSALNMATALMLIENAIRERRKGYICVTGVHGIMEAQRDPGLRAILNAAFLNVPDGMPTVWVGKWQQQAGMGRVFGPELMLNVCQMSVERGYRHFLYGGSEGVASLLAETLQRRFPGLQIVGTYTPPFRPLVAAECEELRERFAELKPDICWVGLSTPKQERFMAEHFATLDTKLMVGVGAAFDFHTGRIADAPDWVKTCGLQWLHRLAQDPRRLWKRYLINNPKFIHAITLQLTGIRKYSIEQPDCTGTRAA